MPYLLRGPLPAIEINLGVAKGEVFDEPVFWVDASGAVTKLIPQNCPVNPAFAAAIRPRLGLPPGDTDSNREDAPREAKREEPPKENKSTQPAKENKTEPEKPKIIKSTQPLKPSKKGKK